MKTAVITGGNSGMGKAIAQELAQKGCRILLHGRDEEKAKLAISEIIALSGNKNVEYIIQDIETISGMKELARKIKLKTNEIHALVLSTGVILSKYELTEDNLEKGFAIQYLSRFAITNLLMDELLKGNAKIVLVGATKIRNAKVYFEDIALKSNFTMLRAMAQEMFCNHLFVQEFAKRYSNTSVVINMGHVGIAKTEIARGMNFFLRLGLKLIGKTPKESAQNFVYLASNDEVTFSGYFLKNPSNKNQKEKIAYDAQIAQKLWEKSMELIR
jgi:NAD(P)-dependent dehydrogenase (short-subunit alcohol dehydrogenase family)